MGGPAGNFWEKSKDLVLLMHSLSIKFLFFTSQISYCFERVVSSQHFIWVFFLHCFFTIMEGCVCHEHEDITRDCKTAYGAHVWWQQWTSLVFKGSLVPTECLHGSQVWLHHMELPQNSRRPGLLMPLRDKNYQPGLGAWSLHRARVASQGQSPQHWHCWWDRL